MIGSRYISVNTSSSAFRFSSPGERWKTPAPPLPNSGFRMMSLCSSRKATISSRSLVIRLGGISSLKWVTNSFSGALRTDTGSFTTSVVGWMCSSRWVAVM